MKVSLTKFCKDYDLPKTSVYRRCQELSIETSQGLDEQAVSALLHEFNVKPEVQISPPGAPSVTVEVGNHQILLNAPQLPQSYTLEGLRTTEAVSIADPLAVAAQFLQAADLVIDGMNQDLKQRQHQLEQTRKAKDAIAAKKHQLELEARLYQMQTSGLDAAVTRTTQTLQDDLTALQRMGKPASGDTATPC